MAVQARLSLHLSKCHIVGNHMTRLIVYTDAEVNHFTFISNSVDPDETAHMSRLIWLYTVCQDLFQVCSVEGAYDMMKPTMTLLIDHRGHILSNTY